MKKRILSLALVLAMVLSMLPATVGAVEPEHVHCLCGEETTVNVTCADCGTKAVSWTGITAMPATTAPGYYYLKNDVSVSPFFVTSGEFAFCLCGNDMTSAAGKRIMDVAGSGTTMSITDCADQVGSVTGATGASATGSALCVNTGATLNLYGGKVTGNTAATNGVILVSSANFNMYGGEISGNTSGRGAVYVDGATSVARFLGGQITGNTGKNTGATGGGAGVYGMKGTVELGGMARIYGNTSAARTADLYIRNDQGAKLALSTTKPMESGAKVYYGLWTAESDTTDLTAITGTPANWSSSWLRYDGTKVGYAAGKFFLDTSADHIHCMCGKEVAEGKTCADCGTKAVLWEGTNSLPNTDGYYYLTETVKTAKVDMTADVSLCLHGKNLESAAGATIVKIMPGGSLQIADCNEAPGSVTGVTATTAIEIQINSAFTFWNGKITGNTGTGNGTVWVAQGTASLPGGSFTMRGGEISGNTTGRGAVFTATTTGVKLATVRLLGGKITGNTGTNSSTSTGSGAGVYALSPVEIGGDVQIFGNTAKVGPGDIFLRNDGSFTGKLIVSTEVPLTEDANICYDLKVAETDTTNLKYITGTPASWSNTWVKYGEDQVGYAEGKFLIDNSVPTPEGHIHCMCGNETTLEATCASCGTKAVEWTGIETMPANDAPGYYYLTADVSVAPFFVSNGEFAFCLNSHTMTSAAGKRMFDASKGAILSITDCQESCGTITGTTGSSGDGSAMSASDRGVLNLYNGKVTGHTGARDGVIYVQIGATTTPGGTFNMYGGEVSGNSGRRGAIFGALATGGRLPSVIRILGGTVTGNTGSGTGNYQGGAGVYAMCTIEVGGTAQIYGNTAAAGAADLLVRNDQNAKLVVSTEVPLTDGANIQYSLWTAESDLTDLKGITGTPASWDKTWVSYDGDPVSYENAKFFTKAKQPIIYADHDHDNKKWLSVTQDNGQLPEGDGYYVLEGDVTLTKELIVLKGNHVHLCLNGHTLTAAEALHHFDVRAGAKLTICDCTAKTTNGTYTAGKLTGGTAYSGGSIRVRAGAELHLYDGIITDNHSGGNGGAIYLDAASNEYPASVFHMYGGMICGNSGTYGGAIRIAAPTGDLAGPTFILEGGTICHNESNYGGAFHAAGNANIQLKGGVIEKNTATQGGGAVSINGTTTVSLTGTTIRDNSATTWGGNVYIKTGAVMNMTGGSITGGSAKIGAGVLLESKDTTLNLQGGSISGNHGGAAGAAGVYASNNTIVNMTGGQISNNVSDTGGGGIVLYAAKGTFTGGSISGNTANGGGGGMCIQGAEVYLGKVTISGNSTTSSSGGIYIARAGEICSDVTIDGAQITNNTCKTSGGGIFLYMNGNKVTMKDGLIAGNQAADGGGVVAQREVTFTMNGGEIKNNKATSNGGGYYASIDSTFVMNGGKISGNYTAKNGGGLYCLRSNVTLNGGSITGNKAKTSGGGIIVNGSTAKLVGATVSYNSCEGSGAGIMVQTATMKVDGVSTKFTGKLTMTGGSVTGNTTPKAAAGVLINGNGATFNFYGGSISHNIADKFGAGIYCGSKGVLNMYGGSVCYNESKLDAAGGVHVDAGIATFTGGSIYGNKAAKSAGGVMLAREDGVVRMSGVKIYENEAKIGGGLVLQSKVDAVIDSCEIYDNTSLAEAGGVYVSTYTHPTFKNTKFYNNTSPSNGGGLWSWATSHVTLEGCEFTNNTAAEGGGVWTRGDAFYMTDCTFTGNTSKSSNGGGFYAGMMGSATPRKTPGLVFTGTTFHQNVASGKGGGLYVSSGAEVNMTDCVFTENQAAGEAGAFWVKDETTLHSITATGNTSGGEGFAVYVASSDYDGQSFLAGLIKMSGNMQIHDNQGGDLYLGEKTAIVIGEDGLAQDTRIEMTMHSGLLTDWVWGSYNYEGGDQVYTITYGDRSMTDPEYAPAAAEDTQADDTQKATQTDNTVLYIGVGIFAVAIIAVIILLLKKKKREPAQEATKE